MKRAHAPVQHELLTDTSDYGNKKCKHERDQIPFSSLSKPPTESPIISVRTSCVAVCAGDGRYNKFFNRDKMEVESLTDEEYNINPPVWTIFEHRGENEGIKAIAMGKDVSFVQTEGGVCWGVGSNQDGMLGVPVETTEIAMRVLPDHVIDTLTSDYYRSLFVTNTGRVFTCGRNNFRGEFGGVKDYLVQLPVELIGETVVPRMVRATVSMYCNLFISCDHMLYANGSNVNYVMGMGDSAEKEYPNIVRVPFPYPISNVTCSDYYTAVVTTDGQCWMVGSHREVTGKTKSVPNWRLYDRGVADCQLGKDFHAFLYKDGTLKIAMHSTTRIVRGVNKISATNYYLIAVTDTNIEYMVGNRFQDLCIDISKFINRTWNLEVSLADSHLMACFYRSAVAAYPPLYEALKYKLCSDVGICCAE